MKKTFPSEAAYVCGIVLLALGTAFMERANLGMSMVVAPAYLVHLALSPRLPFFSFGVAEYTFQALLLVAFCLVLRRFKRSYLFSFVTAVLYGLTLDAMMALTAPLAVSSLPLRLCWYLAGLLLGSVGVAFFFHTYIAPEVYELFVKELSARFHLDIGRCKTAYDCASCALGVALSFAFFGFGHFEGVKLGTIFCALVNGMLIGKCSALMEARWEFVDRLPLAKLFDR